MNVSELARRWSDDFELQAKCEGWMLFWHTGDDVFEVEAITDDEVVEESRVEWQEELGVPEFAWPRVTSDDEAKAHLISQSLGGSRMHLLATYLDRRPIDGEVYLGKEALSAFGVEFREEDSIER